MIAIISRLQVFDESFRGEAGAHRSNRELTIKGLVHRMGSGQPGRNRDISRPPLEVEQFGVVLSTLKTREYHLFSGTHVA